MEQEGVGDGQPFRLGEGVGRAPAPGERLRVRRPAPLAASIAAQSAMTAS